MLQRSVKFANIFTRFFHLEVIAYTDRILTQIFGVDCLVAITLLSEGVVLEQSQPVDLDLMNYLSQPGAPIVLVFQFKTLMVEAVYGWKRLNQSERKLF